MPARIMDGEALATQIKDRLRQRIERLVAAGNTPGLGTILVGDDGPSANYVAMKHRDTTELGMNAKQLHLPATASQNDVCEAIATFNNDPEVSAFIVQYPFPSGLDYEAAIETVDPNKDADGLHPVNLGRLVMGVDALLACTPHGIVQLLAHYEVPVEGAHVVIVGRGLTIGRPLANLLALKRPGLNAAVTVVHTGVKDLGAYTRNADIVIAAAGVPGLIRADMVKSGAAVVAAGVSFRDGKLLSDVADDVADHAGWLSPRIGGVGPMTRAMLMENTVCAAEMAVARGGETAGTQ